MENTNEELPNPPCEVATGPFLRVKVDGVGLTLEVSTKNVITPVAAFLDFGKYPIFFANDTTFSLNVALSMNTSLATMFALYEVI